MPKLSIIGQRVVYSILFFRLYGLIVQASSINSKENIPTIGSFAVVTPIKAINVGAEDLQITKVNFLALKTPLCSISCYVVRLMWKYYFHTQIDVLIADLVHSRGFCHPPTPSCFCNDWVTIWHIVKHREKSGLFTRISDITDFPSQQQAR